MSGQSVSRIALNTAMDLLASGQEEGWFDAAVMMVHFARTIEPCSDQFVESVSSTEMHGDTPVSGYSAGHGDVQYSDDERSEKVFKSSGAYARVGHYRVYNVSLKRCVLFRHYLKSGAFQQFDSDVHDGGFLIHYDSDEIPYLFMRVVLQRVTPPVFDAIRMAIDRIYSTLKSHARFFWSRIFNPNFRNRRLLVIHQQIYSEQICEVIHSTRRGIGPGDVLAGRTLYKREV